MTSREAALRGAGAAAVSAALTVALCATIVGAKIVGPWGYPAEIAGMVVGLVRTAGGLPAITVLLASAAAGAALGVLSRRLRLRRAWRSVVLAASAVVALYVPVWAVLAVSYLADPAPDRLAPRASLILATIFAGYGLVIVGPMLVPGAVLAAVLVERWARPEAIGPAPPMPPLVRRGARLLLIVAASALVTFAALTLLRR